MSPLPALAGFEAGTAHTFFGLAVGLVAATLVGVLVLRIELVDHLHRAAGAGLGPTPGRRSVLLPADRHVLVHSGQVAHAADEAAHGPAGGGGDQRAGGDLGDGAELVGEAGHGAADADAAHLHAAAVAVDDAPLGDVALDHRAPAAQLDQALLVAVLPGEDALFVVAGPGAVAVHRLAEQPGRAAQLVELGQGGQAVEEQADGRRGLDVVLADGAAPGHVHHRHAEGAAVVLAQVVHDAHGVGDVALGPGDAAPGGAGADGHHGRRTRRQAVQPLQAGDLTAGLGVIAHAHPVAG